MTGEKIKKERKKEKKAKPEYETNIFKSGKFAFKKMN